MDAKHLSRRLAYVAAFVSDGARVADIGSDHAYLPANLILTGRIQYAVAGEVAKGPYDNMVKEIKRYGLQDSISPRLANGLEAIRQSDKIDTVTIAGMGGALISQILDSGQSKLEHTQTMILQPNVGAYRVRKWLANNKWKIEDERIIEEDGHVYPIIYSKRTAHSVTYNDKELRFGPYLLKDPANSAFIAMWQSEAQRLTKSISEMKSAPQPPRNKIDQFATQLREIKEVLKK